MGRSPKKGLDYFKKTVDYYSDDKIMDLMDEYGPVGVTIYEIILTIVYQNGYYLEIPMDKLAKVVRRTIGTRWIKDINFVLQVIDYCAVIGLFDRALVQQNIITSAGIQSRYADVTARNKVDKSNYWLLGKDEALLSDDKKIISATEIPISATEIPISVTETEQDKTRQDDSREYINYNSCYSYTGDDEKTDAEGIHVYNSLSVEERVKLNKKCDILIFEKWNRTATRYDYKQAAICLNKIVFKADKKLLNVITDDLIRMLSEALEISADAGAPKWSYTKGIFRNWMNANVKSYDDCVQYLLKKR